MEVTNEEYWNEHAQEYDTLYTSTWCQLEDNRVVTWLKRLALPREPTVLDIGCGTGLALKLLIKAGVTCNYFGFDISPKMIEGFKVERSDTLSVNLAVADLTTYEWTQDLRLDLITSVFGSLSFCKQRWQALQRLAKVQRAGDKVFLMFLAEYSLRRIIQLNFGNQGLYKTRGSRSAKSVAVYYERSTVIRSLLENMGYKIQMLVGDGPACGVWETPTLWALNDWIANHSTILSHTIIVIGEKI